MKKKIELTCNFTGRAIRLNPNTIVSLERAYGGDYTRVLTRASAYMVRENEDEVRRRVAEANK